MTTGSERGGDRITGSLRTVGDDRGAVRIEARLDAEVDDVWSALTDPRRLAAWLGDVEGNLHPGGEFRAYFFASGWQGTGRVESCEPPQRLLVSTRDAKQQPDAPFGHAVEATLTAQDRQTVLVWEERGMPVGLVAPYGAGVQIHVEDLAAYLTGGERCDADARFDELLPAYRELAGSGLDSPDGATG